MTIQQVAAHVSQDEFLRDHYTNLLHLLIKTKRLGEQWIAEHTEEITEFEGYESIYNNFRRSMLTVSTWRFTYSQLSLNRHLFSYFTVTELLIRQTPL